MQADREALEILLNECREARRRLEDAHTSEINPVTPKIVERYYGV